MRFFDPFEELRRMQERMSRLLEEFDRFAFERELTAPLDVIDEGDKYRVVVDLPGFNKEDINVYVEDGDLVIKAERKEEKEEEGKNFIRKERRYGEVYRRVSLPSEIDVDKISAKYNNGVLEIIIPKVEKEKKVIKIE
ncbi:heat shock protein Hsp20 [Ferroglobus placidus DSM 10642]|uniref:Heat shock protein Hsp20 n=1 Tax=Ferroglobus placidus (strain DSM 10642 / AEDII12DO) TaxID=589924 RepID=D3S2L1_FERPA|nr:Hsp20/alpha crystallin family protein [Ferroglobus placidus]ADC64541.1 heat shock protein Hsp20 [Ferroglobus placidus DSM 10642]